MSPHDRDWETCEISIPTKVSYCLKCKEEYNNRFDNQTIADVIYTQHNKANAFSLIRTRARAIAKKQQWISCRNCKYNKHIQIAHIVAIAEFPEDTLVSIVNSIDNLVPLCPNCHWELDNGDLTLARIDS